MEQVYYISYPLLYAVSKMKSRQDLKVPFLDESPLEELKGAKLPTKSDIFRHYWYLHKVSGKQSKQAIRDAAKATLSRWQEANLQPKGLKSVIEDISKWIREHEVKGKSCCCCCCWFDSCVEI